MKPEKPIWQTRHTIRDVIEWDVATWKDALAFWDKRMGVMDGKIGLEIGSRHGGLSLFLALKKCSVVCSDLHGPTEKATQLHRRYEVQDLVSYHCIDAKHIPFPDEYFDVVILKSVLGGMRSEDARLGAQHAAMSEMRRVLRTGAPLLFAENMKASPMHGLLRRRLIPWGRDWQYFTEKQMGGPVIRIHRCRYALPWAVCQLGGDASGNAVCFMQSTKRSCHFFL